ncbi:hypothetical protein UFOVP833_30 [uncultured Caudovirales phage]|uniref:Uncharacterized protein n=1 Tax=uncultured Caudovirales phage TaxID=2100421 RepID=A0A6J5NZN3_9CAUD|nr:hypothetical protein UFOVP833_30 [uncultured Caudovirales phage]CAB4218839.1 hypothetical protein UFOVP1603_57 [uncultured Caudovirales phage]
MEAKHTPPSLSSAIAEMRALLAKATQGTWIAAAGPSSIVGWPVVSSGGRSICRITWQERAVPAGEAEETKEETRANARLVAAAHNAMPSLLEALERYEKVLADIARQRIRADMPEDDQLHGDFEGAYDHMIRLARAALEEPQT